MEAPSEEETDSDEDYGSATSCGDASVQTDDSCASGSTLPRLLLIIVELPAYVVGSPIGGGPRFRR
jgi:hypothetical protein